MEDFLIQIKNIVSKSATNNIAIIGKGASVDSIQLDSLNNFITIGINDAERIIPCDITIFHEEWVINSLSDNNFNSKLYLTNKKIKNSNATTFESSFIPSKSDEIDLVFKRLLSNDFSDLILIEEVIFFTALKISRLISKELNKKLNVYLLGFDFDTSKGYSRKLIKDYSKALGQSFKETRITPQEHYYQNALYALESSEIVLHHVGSHVLSNLTSTEFNIKFSKYNDSNGESNKFNVLITAELTTNHFGDRDRLKKMIELSKLNGADLIKVQKRDVDTFYSKKQLDAPYNSPFGKTFGDYRKQLELSKKDFEYLDEICREIGIPWFASILDWPSYLFIKDFNPLLIKIPSTISEDREFISRVAKDYKNDIVISTGMTTIEYENFIISQFENSNLIYLMHTNSGYPTPLNDLNINVLKHYSSLNNLHSNLVPAFSSHDNGWFGSSLAVVAGAKMIEKHVKLGNSNWAHFDAVALDLLTNEFLDYVLKIRETELALGQSAKKINSSENHKYRVNNYV
jgi:N-acetylneuraminate synthase